MNYFKTRATEEQKTRFEELLKSHVTCGLFEGKKEKKCEVANLCKYSEMMPEYFKFEECLVTYNVESVELIKIDSVDYYKIVLVLQDTQPACDSITMGPITVKVSLSTKEKEKYIGNCKEVILTSMLHGILGPSTTHKRLSYAEVIPLAFQDRIITHTPEELEHMYIDTIIAEAETFYRKYWV